MLTRTQREENAAYKNRMPLHAVQNSIYFFEKLHPFTATYHHTFACTLRGNLNLAHFKQALQLLMQRHETLQCRLVEAGGQSYLEPLARSDSASPNSPFHFFKLTQFELPPPVEALEDTLKSIGEEGLIKRGFSLQTEVLWRCVLLQFSDQEYQFLVIAHHIIMDVSSQNIFLRDLTELYNALCENRPAELPELPQNLTELISPPIDSSKLAYWKSTLEGLTPLIIKTDFRPQTDFSHRGNRVYFEINDDHLIRQLNELAKTQNITVHQIFLACFYILLYRYTGQTDICLGTTSANRRNYSEAVNEVLSCFVNSVPIRIALEGKQSFNQLVQQLSFVSKQAYQNQIPLDLIIQHAMGNKEKASIRTASPFSVIFNLNKNKIALGLKDLIASDPIELNLGYSKFPYFGLNLDVTSDGHYKGFIEYNTDLFDESTIARMKDHFINICHGITQAPQEKIADLTILTPEEHTALTQANLTSREFDFEDYSINYTFSAIAKSNPQKKAVIFHKANFETTELTYGELNKKSETLAALLRALGVSPDKRVGLCLSRSPNLITAIYSVFKANGVLLPLENTNNQLLHYKINESHPKVIIVDNSTKSINFFNKDVSESTIINIDNWDQIKTLSTQLGLSSNRPALQGEHLAYITYTSGSTGNPKGVMTTHLGLANAAAAIADRQLQPGSKVLCTARPEFDCFFFEMLEALMTGGELHLIYEEARLSPSIIQAIISLYGLNVVTLLPIISNGLNFEELPSLYDIVIMGSIAKEDTIKRLADLVTRRKDTNNPLTVRIEYGVQEASIFSTEHPYQPEEPHTCIGRPIRNTRLFVLDENGYECPIGVPGTLYIEGPSLARGYVNNPSLTMKKFVYLHYEPDLHKFSVIQNFKKRSRTRNNILLLYNTGDRVYRRANGSIDFISRIEGDRQVKIHGAVRIELDGIEAHLQSHPRIKDAHILFDEETQTLKGYLVLNDPEIPLTKTEINAYLLEQPLHPQLARLNSVHLVKMFPVNANGKIDIPALEKLAAEENTEKEQLSTKLAILPAPPRTDEGESSAHINVLHHSIQYKLLSIWNELLGLNQNSEQLLIINSSFNQLGGGSMDLARLEMRLNNEFNLSQPISLGAQLNYNTTIEELTHTIYNLTYDKVLLHSNPAGLFNTRDTAPQTQSYCHQISDLTSNKCSS